MTVTTDKNGFTQIEVQDFAEQQVLLNALRFYADHRNADNPNHMMLAREMADAATDEYIKDVVLTEEQLKIING